MLGSEDTFWVSLSRHECWVKAVVSAKGCPTRDCAEKPASGLLSGRAWPERRHPELLAPELRGGLARLRGDLALSRVAFG